MEKALETMINNMPLKTGKALNEWKSLLKTKSFNKHSEAVNFLKKEHNVSHGFANTIVSLAKDENSTAQELVRNQYIGKENLFPIYEELIKVVKTIAKDVKIVSKKTEVSLERNKKFAVIKAASKSRIDVGLKLKAKGLTDRLEHSGPFGTMCTHRVRISELDQIDNELIDWLTEAYQKAE